MSRAKKWTLLTEEKWVCTCTQNIHIPRSSEVSLSVFCCNAFSLHYYASESENRIACYPICPMGRKLSPHKLLGSLYFLEKEKNKISMTKIEFPLHLFLVFKAELLICQAYFSHFKTEKIYVFYNNQVLWKWLNKVLICFTINLISLDFVLVHTK